MTEQTSNKLAVTNYDRIKAMTKNGEVIKTFAAVLGSKTSAQAYISSALLAVSNSDQLMECTPASVWQSALRAATMRLSCDPALGQAYLVPFNDRHKGKVATLIVGYKGIKHMALRTNKYRYINPGRLYEGQMIVQDQLTGSARIVGQRQTDKVIAYFCYFEYFNGYTAFLGMTVEELWAHAERYSKGYQSAVKYGRKDSLWHTDFDAMALKTVTRINLLRNGTLSPDDAAALQALGEDADTLSGEVIDSTFEDIKMTDAEIEAGRPAKQTNGQILSDLGFDQPAPNGNGSKPEPAHEPQAQQSEAPATTPDQPEQPPLFTTEHDSRGKTFEQMTLSELAFHMTEYVARLKKNPQDEDTLKKHDACKYWMEQKRYTTG